MPGSRSIRDQMQAPRAYGAPMGAPPVSRPPAAVAPPRQVAAPNTDAAAHQAAVAGGLYRKPIGSTASPPTAAQRPQPVQPTKPTQADLSALGNRWTQVDSAVDRMSR